MNAKHKIVSALASLCLLTGACASLRTSNGSLNVPVLISYAQAGIDADCKFGAGALAADVCTFGTDAITAAQAAVTKDPVAGVSAAKKILQDAEVTQPKIAPYVDWLIALLGK